MNLTFDSKVVCNVIKEVLRVTGASTLEIGVVPSKKNSRIKIAAQGNGKSIVYYCDAKVKTPGFFGCDANVLAGILKSRKMVNLIYEDNTVKFKEVGTGYHGDFATTPIEESEMITPDSKTLVSKDLQKALKTIIPKISISDVHTAQPTYIMCKSTKRGTILASNDNIHLAYYENPELKSPRTLEFEVLRETLELLSSLSDGEVYELSFLENLIYAESPDWKITLPLSQPEGSATLGAIEKLIKDKQPSISIKLNTEEFVGTINNMIPICDQASEIICKVSDGVMAISVVTSYGKLKNQISIRVKSSKPVEFKLDPLVISDLFNLIGNEEVTMHIIDKKMLWIKQGTDYFYVTYLV